MKSKLLLIRVMRRFAASASANLRLTSCALLLIDEQRVSIWNILGFTPLTIPPVRYVELGADWVSDTVSGSVIWTGSNNPHS